eukprot:1128378-Karenia_brevis.AAC.1
MVVVWAVSICCKSPAVSGSFGSSSWCSFCNSFIRVSFDGGVSPDTPGRLRFELSPDISIAGCGCACG